MKHVALLIETSRAYPYAVEHDDKLYVCYSNSGDKSTRVGTGR